MKKIYFVSIYFIVLSCTTTKYVTVPEVHEVHHHHTDSVFQTDSVIHEKQTTIMQLDSAEMAKYGIRLNQAEKAWLIRTEELQRQIERLEAMSSERDTVKEEIPVIVEKEVYVEKNLSWLQKTLMWSGGIAILIVVIFILIKFQFFGLWRWIKSML